MNRSDLARLADENLAASWAVLGATMGATVAEVGPLTLVSTGIALPFFNGAYLLAPTDDSQRLVTAAIEFFAKQNVPWLLWVREGLCPAMLDAGRAAGLRGASGPPAMGLDPIPTIPASPPGLTIEIATTTDALAEHAAVLRDGFEMPPAIVDRLIRPALLEQPNAAALVGRIDRTPVSCSLVTVTGTTAGIYNVATPAAFRGQGHGAALTWAAVAEGVRRGCTRAVLQASQSGYPVYRRMGFADLGRYIQLEGPPRS
jgi:GNAT superfamily N-acetyltransferase